MQVPSQLLRSRHVYGGYPSWQEDKTQRNLGFAHPQHDFLYTTLILKAQSSSVLHL